MKIDVDSLTDGQRGYVIQQSIVCKIGGDEHEYYISRFAQVHLEPPHALSVEIWKIGEGLFISQVPTHFRWLAEIPATNLRVYVT